MPDVKTTQSLPTPTQPIQPGGATVLQGSRQQEEKSREEKLNPPSENVAENRQKQIVEQIQTLVEKSKSSEASQSKPTLKIPESENPSKKREEQGKLLEQIGQIVKQHGGAEANIPLSSEYWDLLNRYRSLNY